MGSGNVFSNNLYYTAGRPTIVAAYGGDKTLEQWQTYGTHTDELNENPLFAADPSDLSILQNSPALDSGLGVGVPYASDFDDVSRPQGSRWDIGAYEYH
jgi:hypothetical protein